MTSSSPLRVSPEVAAAISDGQPVVALESTIFSRLGLPSPHNADALASCLGAVLAGGAVPAVTCVLNGVARVGIDPGEHEQIFGGTRKVAERDLGVACGLVWDVGVTTVSAAVRLAALAGIRVFATGGIGGVHREASLSGDVSADLDALRRYPVVTVSAGAKGFLDLGRTLEYLETAGVPVLGFCTDDFPAFYTRASGFHVPYRVSDATEAAAVARAHWDLGGGGLLLANPIPATDEIDPVALDDALDAAVAAAASAGISGAGVTPFILERIAVITEGRSLPANLSLATSNAAVAAAVAVAVTLTV